MRVAISNVKNDLVILGLLGFLAVYNIANAGELVAPTFDGGQVLDKATLDGVFGTVASEVTGNARDLVTHSSDATAHHAKTTSFSELTDQAADAQIPAAIARDSELGAHAADVGAHHTKTSSFSELTGQAADTQIPAAITRDIELDTHAADSAAHHARYTNSEAVAAIKAADGTGSNLDADTLDGFNSSDFAASNQGCATGSFVRGITNIGDLVCDSVSAPPVTRTISIQAQALAVSPSSTIISQGALGLDWTQNFASAAYLTVRKPADYAGGSVTMSLFFRTSTATAGVVQFFIRPRSYNVNDTWADVPSRSDSGVSVSALRGLYQQDIVIPAGNFAKEWWHVTIQRQGSSSTYPDSLTLMSVSLEYTSVQ